MPLDIFTQSGDPVAADAVCPGRLPGIYGNPVTIEFIETVIGADPHKAKPVLQEAVYFGTGQMDSKKRFDVPRAQTV